VSTFAAKASNESDDAFSIDGDSVDNDVGEVNTQVIKKILTLVNSDNMEIFYIVI